MVKKREGFESDPPLLHPGHRRPLTRREFLGQGFLTGAATVLLPTLGGLVTPQQARAQASCALSGFGSGMIPFICFDLAGGANIAGSNVLVGGPGGQLDFLTDDGYDKLGLPSC